MSRFKLTNTGTSFTETELPEYTGGSGDAGVRGTLIRSTASKGVSIDDVKVVLTSSSNDLGTLCKSSNINPTARYKPFKGGGTGVEVNLFDPVPGQWPGWENGSEFNADGNNHLSNRANATFGTSISNLTFDTDGFPNGGAVWIFNAPTGGANEPFRLSDFNGYIHTPANCWSNVISSAPHFALRWNSDIVSSQTDARRKFQMVFYSFVKNAGNVNPYYLTLADIALTNFSNFNSLYLWVAIIADRSNTRLGGRKIYAKRLPISLGTMFSGSHFPITGIEFDIVKDFPPVSSGSGESVTFDSVSDNRGLYDIKGTFQLQFFIGPKINEFYYSDDPSNKFGIISNIYDSISNGGNISNSSYIKNTYGLTALQLVGANTASLAGANAGSDISTIRYAVVSWNTSLTQIWCNSNKVEKTPSSVVTLVSKVSNNGKTTFTLSTDLKFLFNRGNIGSVDYYDTTSTTVYYKVIVSYLITVGISFTIGSSTTTHTNTNANNPYSETTSSGSVDVPLGGSSAPSGIPPQTAGIPTKVTVNTENYSVLILKIELQRNGSSSGTYTTVLEETLTLY